MADLVAEQRGGYKNGTRDMVEDVYNMVEVLGVDYQFRGKEELFFCPG